MVSQKLQWHTRDTSKRAHFPVWPSRENQRFSLRVPIPAVKYITYYDDTIFFLVDRVRHTHYIYRLLHFIKSSWVMEIRTEVANRILPSAHPLPHTQPTTTSPSLAVLVTFSNGWTTICVIGFIQPHYKASAIFSFICLVSANTFWGQKNTRRNVS